MGIQKVMTAAPKPKPMPPQPQVATITTKQAPKKVTQIKTKSSKKQKKQKKKKKKKKRYSPWLFYLAVLLAGIMLYSAASRFKSVAEKMMGGGGPGSSGSS